MADVVIVGAGILGASIPYHAPCNQPVSPIALRPRASAARSGPSQSRPAASGQPAVWRALTSARAATTAACCRLTTSRNPALRSCPRAFSYSGTAWSSPVTAAPRTLSASSPVKAALSEIHPRCRAAAEDPLSSTSSPYTWPRARISRRKPARCSASRSERAAAGGLNPLRPYAQSV